jgi:hypothetical protein
MPKIARVRLSDGRVARLSVPDNATPEQVVSFAKTKLAQNPQGGGVMGAIRNVVSSGNELLLGGIEGVYNAASAITDPIAERAINFVSGDGSGTKAVEGANHDRRAVVNAAERTFIPEPNPVARTAGRVAGALAIPVPKAAQAGRVARIAVRALQGAVGGAAVREVDQSATAPAVTGAVANVVLPPAISALARTAPARAVGRAISSVASPVIGAVDNAAEAALPGVNALLGKTPPVPLRGIPAPAQAPLDPLGREATARLARFRSVGVDNPTTGMVTRDPAAFSFEQNVSKMQGVGEGLSQQMRNVESRLVETGRSLVNRYGGAKGAETTGQNIAKALEAKRSEMQTVTSGLYREVRASRGNEAVGRLDTLRERMTDPDMVDNAAFDQMREALVRRMTRLGAVGKNGSLSQPVNIGQAEELRKFIGGLGNNAEPGVRMMRGKLIEALDDDVVNAVGGDAFKAARASAKARFDEFSKTFPGRLADERLAPEVLAKRVLGDSVRFSDIRALRNSLHTGTPEQIARGREAWKGLQAQALDDLLGKSVDADGNLAGTTLWREFSSRSDKFREILNPQDFKMLRRLAAATRDAKSYPAGHSVNTSNTAVTLGNMFANAPEAVRQGWAKLLAKSGGMHAAAFLSAGPAGNFALGTGQAVMAANAQSKAAQALLAKVRMAQSPEAAAAAIREAKAAAASNPIVAEALQKAGIAIGGAAAAASQ